MAKHSINLLQAELIPVQPLWTLNRVAAVWGIAFFFMLLCFILGEVLLSFSLTEQQKLERINSQTSAQVTALEAKIKNHKADAKLVSHLDNVKFVMENKSFLIKQLTDKSQAYVSGFSTAMTELSDLHHKGISLNKVSINAEQITFSGLARTPSVVPSWLAGFERSTFLAGKRFVNFSLSESENNFTHFTVSSEKDALENP